MRRRVLRTAGVLCAALALAGPGAVPALAGDGTSGDGLSPDNLTSAEAVPAGAPGSENNDAFVKAVPRPSAAGRKAPAPGGGATVPVQLLSTTDFHGYLAPPTPGEGGEIPDGKGNKVTVGGAAYLAAQLDRLRAGQSNSTTFSTGDNFSGWPFEVDAFGDEPTVEVLNKFGIEFSAIGNHELDVSANYLLRHMQDGKCTGTPGVEQCFPNSAGKPFKGSKFPYLTGNIAEKKSGKQITRATTVKWFRAPGGKRVPVGFINLTVPDTPVGSTSFQPDLKSSDTTERANFYAKRLKRQGVKAIVVNMHDGGTQSDGFTAGWNECRVGLTGPAADVAKNATPDIDAIITGHWHSRFNCTVNDPAGNPRPVVEAGNHGALINETNLQLDARTGEVLRDRTVSTNHPVTRDITPDPAVKKIVDHWVEQGAKRSAQPVGTQTGDLTRKPDADGESTMGNLAADVELWTADRSRRGRADLAMLATKPRKGSTALGRDLPMAPGTDPRYPGDAEGRITYKEAWYAFGYGNPVLTVSLKGSDILKALEGQWRREADGKVSNSPLAVSKNVSYRFDANAEPGSRVAAKDVLIGGQALDPAKDYRVAVLAYTVIGGDEHPAFAAYRDAYRNTPADRETFVAYLREHPEITPPGLDRVMPK